MTPKVNVPILLLSLALSLTAWFAVYGQNLHVNKTLTLRLGPSNISGLDPTKWYVNNVGKITIQLQAPGVILDKLLREEPEKNVTIDYKDVAPGPVLYPIMFDGEISKYVVSAPTRVEVSSERIKSKQVKVVIESKGRLSDSTLGVQGMAIVPKSVLVTGPESIINKVAKAHGFLDLPTVDTSHPDTQEVSLTAVGTDGQVFPDIGIQPGTVEVQALLSPTSSEKRVLVSANIKGTPASGYVRENVIINPTAVMLTGNFSVLSNTSFVLTDPIDVSGLTASKQFKVKLRLPIGVHSEDGPTVRVRFLVKPVEGSNMGNSTTLSNSTASGSTGTTTTASTGGGNP